MTCCASGANKSFERTTPPGAGFPLPVRLLEPKRSLLTAPSAVTGQFRFVGSKNREA